MKTSFEQIFYSSANDFLLNLKHLLDKCHVPFFSFPVDHLCYRVSTGEEYSEVKKNLNQMGTCLVESMVGGRLIATFKLQHPILFLGQSISLIELPSPKPGRNYETGWEHAEAVIPFSFEEWMAKFPHLTFDQSGTHKKINPELRLLLNDKYSVKFHHQSLELVITWEKNLS